MSERAREVQRVKDIEKERGKRGTYALHLSCSLRMHYPQVLEELFSSVGNEIYLREVGLYIHPGEVVRAHFVHLDVFNLAINVDCRSLFGVLQYELGHGMRFSSGTDQWVLTTTKLCTHSTQMLRRGVSNVRGMRPKC